MEREKKTERLEIRLPYSQKKVFVRACEERGDKPSSVLRRFIQNYVQQTSSGKAGSPADLIKSFVKKPISHLATISTCALIGAAFYNSNNLALENEIISPNLMAANTASQVNYQVFASYDKNANGVLDVGEIASNDIHLHWVMNLDGAPGIAPAEFFSKGRMRWEFIDPSSLVLSPHVSYQKRGAANIVEFDLSNPEKPSIEIQSQIKLSGAGGGTYDRIIGWEQGKDQPALTFTDQDYRPRLYDSNN